jgi:non-heme chloroperoxidase
MPSSASFRVGQIRLADGLQFEYAEQGPRGGPTVLMLHGITDSWRSFEPVLPLLPAHWHVVALSQRGHGGSDKAPRSYRTADFAADAAAFARQLDLAPMIVVGHSMGAANALRLALDAPELVQGLVLAGAFARFSDKMALRAFYRDEIVPLVDPVPPALARAFQMDTVAQPVAPGLIDAMVDESLRSPAPVWRAAFASLFDDHFSDELPHVDVPTLIAWGDADAFVPREDTAMLAAGIARSRVSVYAGTGHALHWEQPARFARELVAFAASLQRTAPGLKERLATVKSPRRSSTSMVEVSPP